MTVAKLTEQAGRRTGERAQGLDVVVIQDTTEISVNVTDAGRAGFGPIGRGGASRGVLAHVDLCVDKSGTVLGLVDAKVWTRTGGKRVSNRHGRSFTEKESHRWLATCETAKTRLSCARSITMVSDAESDIYELFAGKPEGVELVVRSSKPRRLVGGEMLSQKLNNMPSCGMIERSIPAAPGRKERRAQLQLRYAQVVIKRPDQLGAHTAAEIAVSAVDVREVDAPEGILPVHWLIMTSYETETLQKAAETIDLYRGRFLIEQLFRTLKTAEFNIEALELSDPQAFIAFTGLALLASTTILQLVKARDGNSGQHLSLSFEADDKPVLMVLSHKLEGKTEKRKTHIRQTTLPSQRGSWLGSEDGTATMENPAL
ncbi:MAG: IS4 family transposase [Alphaproteobacteria bacterium]|nr:IS4 family transposase [Alphaproteobacteria bacterium]